LAGHVDRRPAVNLFYNENLKRVAVQAHGLEILASGITL
jgi:hypothetical protein